MDEKVLAVQRMQDYISKHIDKEIKLVDLASESLYSPWYTKELVIEKVTEEIRKET